MFVQSLASYAVSIISSTERNCVGIRSERVATAETKIYAFLNDKQRAFVNFVLSNYIKAGVDELDIEKLPPALVSKYGGMYEAERELGNVEDIKRMFVDFQQHLYTEKVA